MLKFFQLTPGRVQTIGLLCASLAVFTLPHVFAPTIILLGGILIVLPCWQPGAKGQPQ